MYFLRDIIMWYVSGLSCRKSGSCHSHIDEVVYYVPTGITFSFLLFILSCASMLWIEWISDFLFFLFFCFFSCSFWWSYNNTVVLFCQYIFVFFLLFIISFYYTENLIAIFLMKQEILSPNWRVVSVYFL